MAEILEFPEFAQHDRVAKVQIRSRGIGAKLYFERSATLQALAQFLFKFVEADNFYGIANFTLPSKYYTPNPFRQVCVPLL